MLNGEQKKISGRERKTEKVAKETFKEWFSAKKWIQKELEEKQEKLQKGERQKKLLIEVNTQLM